MVAAKMKENADQIRANSMLEKESNSVIVL
jgi:hypothetical protein